MPAETPQINIVIPMAGAGSRFAKAGYKDPKPLIPVHGKPMIQVVIENLKVKNARFIFIVQRSHFKEYQLGTLLPSVAPGCEIVQIDGITEGAACTVLKAAEFINNDVPILIGNSDQFLEWNAQSFVDVMLKNSEIDGVISTFVKNEPDTKWSYAKLDAENRYVVDCQEKKPISNLATTGIYLWRKGSDFVKYANEMVEKNIRSNNEFYVCPVYNFAIQEGKKIVIDNCDKMWGIGVPDDLEYFLKNYGGKV